MHRRILHIDMDAFFAAVEQRDDPALRGRPVIVGGSPDGRGVVATASYEARRFGVRSAMPAAEAARRCPQAVFLRPDMARYAAVSASLRAILCEYTELVEPLSLDECYLDVSHRTAWPVRAVDVARELKRRIREELGLTASAGVAPVKFVAKIASDWDKPDGLTVVRPERVQEFIRPLEVGRLWGVGPATERRLAALGIRTVGELAARPREELERRLGRQGGFLWRLAHGEDDREVSPARDRKSLGAERTFSADVDAVDALVDTLSAQARQVAEGLARRGLRARTVSLKVRYAGFETVTRSASLPVASAEAEVFVRCLLALLDRTEAGARPVRLVGLSVSGLESADGAPSQLAFPWGRP